MKQGMRIKGAKPLKWDIRIKDFIKYWDKARGLGAEPGQVLEPGQAPVSAVVKA
jgi:hypothetical protein